MEHGMTLLGFLSKRPKKDGFLSYLRRTYRTLTYFYLELTKHYLEFGVRCMFCRFSIKYFSISFDIIRQKLYGGIGNHLVLTDVCKNLFEINCFYCIYCSFLTGSSALFTLGISSCVIKGLIPFPRD